MDERLKALVWDGDGVLAPTLELYLDLHRNPELSGQERWTAARFADAIATAGLDTYRDVGGHGVVGMLANGDGPTVSLRCELDALPVEERTGLVYASRVRLKGPDGVDVPVMHACGHDAHMAAMAGAAQLLVRLRQEWSGTLVVVGQPAEETLAGARAMLADGLYRRFPRPDVVLAQHVAPFLAGVVGHGSGPMTATGATVEAVVHGRGGHAAAPHLAVNPIEVVASAVRRIAEFGRVRTDPGERVVITVGTVRAGTRANIIPDDAHLGISLRSLSDACLAEATTAVRDILRAESIAAGSAQPPTWSVLSTAALNVNDPYFASVVRRAHESVFGVRRVVPCAPTMAVEDFPLYGAAGVDLYGGPPVPTVYWMVGSVGQRLWAHASGGSTADRLTALPSNHSSRYAPEPVPTLRTGIVAMVAAALGCFADDTAPGDRPSREADEAAPGDAASRERVRDSVHLRLGQVG